MCMYVCEIYKEIDRYLSEKCEKINRKHMNFKKQEYDYYQNQQQE